MKVNTYKLLNQCIEDGINGGYAKAHKHTDTPSEGHLKDMIHNYIMVEIDEVFDFNDWYETD
jgi:hypothetical protein